METAVIIFSGVSALAGLVSITVAVARYRVGLVGFFRRHLKHPQVAVASEQYAYRRAFLNAVGSLSPIAQPIQPGSCNDLYPLYRMTEPYWPHGVSLDCSKMESTIHWAQRQELVSVRTLHPAEYDRPPIHQATAGRWMGLREWRITENGRRWLEGNHIVPKSGPIAAKLEAFSRYYQLRQSQHDAQIAHWLRDAPWSRLSATPLDYGVVR